MTKPMRKSHQLLKPLNQSLFDLPAPTNLSYMWNFGSLLGLCLLIQVITGLLLAMHYSPHTDIAFDSISHITRNVNSGWLLRNMHANTASAFFLCLYLHMSRSLYFYSFKMKETWNLGVTIFILSMATAFMGYLLPWGQMSFWGATVITNLFSAIPYVGKATVEWMWGGFGVNTATLTRFFALHFLLPFMISFLVILHLLFLHESGSNNPLGTASNSIKTPFHPHYTAKDIMGFTILMITLTIISMFFPTLLTDPENFIPANPLVTPTHIKPEWYFLWAYAILRSIPNKLGGVMMMFTAMFMLYLLPMMNPPQQGSSFNAPSQLLTWVIGTTLILLTWIGGSPVEPPYEMLGKILTIMYFMTFTIMMTTNKPT